MMQSEKLYRMKKNLAFLCRCIRHILRIPGVIINRLRLHMMLFINNVQYQSIHSNGMPYFCVAVSGTCMIGKNFQMNNGLRFNPIGYPYPCTVYVGKEAKLIIGNNVGISQASIICHQSIEIQDNVKIGGV